MEANYLIIKANLMAKKLVNTDVKLGSGTVLYEAISGHKSAFLSDYYSKTEVDNLIADATKRALYSVSIGPGGYYTFPQMDEYNVVNVYFSFGSAGYLDMFRIPRGFSSGQWFTKTTSNAAIYVRVDFSAKRVYSSSGSLPADTKILFVELTN